jgi:DNA-damage-inducible protein D
MESTHLIPLEGKNIRKVWHNDEWYISVIDIIEVLTDSSNPNRYWTDLKRRSEKESGQSYAFCVSMKLAGTDGRKRLTDCANAEGILRIVMSVPSPKAEPIRMWLAEQGKRTIDETENPELITERQAEIYKAKGYSEEWILRRMQTIDARKQLTEEWKNRGVKEGQEYSILTATIAKGTFGLSPSEHSQLKGLKNENLRDHMTPLELILTALGEEVTRTIAVDENAQGFEENHDAAIKGGEVGKKALKNVEAATKKKVVSKENYLNTPKESSELPAEK